MGQVESRPSYFQQVQNEDGNFVIVTNDPIKVLHFNTQESFMISYGIDQQTSPSFKHKTLGPVTGSDAQLVCNTLIDRGVFPSQNTAVHIASKQTENCKFAGMKQTFLECAAKVGPDGLFVFHFSGHGIKVGANEWGLAPADFDFSHSTYLTAAVLMSWINESKCKAKHVLFTLDCCYAGGIGRELTKSVKVEIDANICVLSACSGYETSLVIGPLRNSIFTYFLATALLNSRAGPGVLPLNEIFSLCQACCEALSSLLVRYTSDHGLKLATMQPQLGVLNLKSRIEVLSGEGQDQTDAAARLAFVTKHFDSKWHTPDLSEKAHAYLESVSAVDTNGPLLQLLQKGVLRGKVLRTAVCSMMYSVASIELVCNTTNINNPNHSITAFMFCAAAIDIISPGVDFDQDMFFISWLFYREVLTENNANTTHFGQMYDEMMKNYTSQQTRDAKSIKQPDSTNHFDTSSDSTDFPDYIEASSVAETSMLIPAIHRWSPITDAELSSTNI